MQTARRKQRYHAEKTDFSGYSCLQPMRREILPQRKSTGWLVTALREIGIFLWSAGRVIPLASTPRCNIIA